MWGLSGQSISFVFGARVGHFAATLQSDVEGIWSRDLGVMATAFGTTENAFFRAFNNPQITDYIIVVSDKTILRTEVCIIMFSNTRQNFAIHAIILVALLLPSGAGHQQLDKISSSWYSHCRVCLYNYVPERKTGLMPEIYIIMFLSTKQL